MQCCRLCFSALSTGRCALIRALLCIHFGISASAGAVCFGLGLTLTLPGTALTLALTLATPLLQLLPLTRLFHLNRQFLFWGGNEHAG